MKKTYSIATSFRSKPNHLICCCFSLKKKKKNGRQTKKFKQKQGQRLSVEYFHNDKLVWNMVV